MTRLWVLSDLHLRQRDALDLVKPSSMPDADVCVVAGDVCGRLNLTLNWLAKVIQPHMPVVAVLGNHEFYGTSLQSARKNAAMIARSMGVTLLDDSEATLCGVRFVGAPLWTDFRLYENDGVSKDRAMTAARVSMADYGEISFLEEDRYRQLRPEDTVRMHEHTLSYLEGAFKADDHSQTVVVTHHAPHPGSIHARYADDDVTPAFVSDLSRQIGRWRPSLWIHGHVHSSFDYVFDGIRIVCNPRGYREGLENPAFDFKKVVTI
jgi:Icc-related predicted phosphoesterase